MRALAAVLGQATDDPSIGAAVLVGAAQAFCAGSDLKELGVLDIEGMQRHEGETAAVARSIAFLPLPLVAAVKAMRWAAASSSRRAATRLSPRRMRDGICPKLPMAGCRHADSARWPRASAR